MNKVKIFGVAALVFACFAFAFLTELPRFLKYQNGDIKDFETVGAGELQKGDLVQGTIDFTEGCIATMETSNTTFGITTSKRTSSQYYAVYMYNNNCILYETSNSAQYATLDRMGEEYIRYLESYDEAFTEDGDIDTTNVIVPETTMEFTGVVNGMSSDLEAIFREWYGDDAAYAAEAESVIITYSDFSRFAGMIYAGIGCAVLAVVMLVLTIVVWRKSKQEQQFSY